MILITAGEWVTIIGVLSAAILSILTGIGTLILTIRNGAKTDAVAATVKEDAVVKDEKLEAIKNDAKDKESKLIDLKFNAAVADEKLTTIHNLANSNLSMMEQKLEASLASDKQAREDIKSLQTQLAKLMDMIKQPTPAGPIPVLVENPTPVPVIETKPREHG